MRIRIPFEKWALEFATLASEFPTPQPRITVVKDVDSTQDEARRRNAIAGDVIVAWRQIHGRGRLGRSWIDTGEDGVAMTMVVPRDRPERLAIASAVGVASAIELLLKIHGAKNRPVVGIKWPNDVVVNGCKIAGILIEQFDDLALIGIGINVSQRTWPVELKGRAISMAELGADLDRIEVAQTVIQTTLGHLRDSDDRLTELFNDRDVLQGTTAIFRNNGRDTLGTVLRIDPMRGLSIQTSESEVWFPAASTSVVTAVGEAIA